MVKYFTILICLVILMSVSGCVNYSTGEEAASGGSFYINSYRFPAAVNMVALFELDNKSSYGQISEDVTKELYHHLQQNAFFGTNIINNTDSRWNNYRLDVYSSYTVEEVNRVLNGVKCDSALIGAITEYQPYPYLHIGIRLKLIDLRDGQLLWAYENTWNSNDRSTKDRMIDYYRANSASGQSELQSEILSISSKNFIKFITKEATDTLKDREVAYNNQ